MKKTFFHNQSGLKFKEDTSEVLHLEMYGAETLTLLNVDQKLLVNQVLQKNGKDQLDRSCKK
jgi:hypothetical protein